MCFNLVWKKNEPGRNRPLGLNKQEENLNIKSWNVKRIKKGFILLAIFDGLDRGQ